MAVLAGNASAITTDGDWSDWFTYGGTVWNDWDQAAAAGSLTSSNIRVFDDEEGPTPGGGGQPFDIEQIFYTYEDNGVGLTGGTLHVGMVTGFPPAGLDPLFAGDLFLGLGGSGDLNIGVVVATDAGRSGLFGNAYFGDVSDWVDPDPGPFVSSTPWRINEATATDVTGALSPVVAWGDNDANGSRYFLEVAISLDGAGEEAITNDTTGGLSLHWTMGCGNDEITVHDQTPFPPVPEPTTMVLLGMGVLGMALRARRPMC
jgi:hypothetical protein